jgi:hypothetical protein
MQHFDSFDDFYRTYREAHSHPWNRRLHLLGWVVGGVGAACVLDADNESLVFRHPVLSALGDLRMFTDMLFGG